MFDCFKKTLKVFGFRFYEFKEDHECDQIDSGRRLISENHDRIYDDLLLKNTKATSPSSKLPLSQQPGRQARPEARRRTASL